jgi:hypothetical protein
VRIIFKEPKNRVSSTGNLPRKIYTNFGHSGPIMGADITGGEDASPECSERYDRGRSCTIGKSRILGPRRPQRCEKGAWNDSPAHEEPELEFVCGAVGEIGERGMPVEADSVCGAFTAASVAALCGALP